MQAKQEKLLAILTIGTEGKNKQWENLELSGSKAKQSLGGDQIIAKIIGR